MNRMPMARGGVSARILGGRKGNGKGKMEGRKSKSKTSSAAVVTVTPPANDDLWQCYVRGVPAPHAHALPSSASEHPRT